MVCSCPYHFVRFLPWVVIWQRFLWFECQGSRLPSLVMAQEVSEQKLQAYDRKERI